jgi:sec-independent protein translocase protein TatB
MFDIGWGELFLIGIVALIVVGPKDLPGLFRSLGQFTAKARGMAREFQRSLDQAANEAGMTEMQKSLRSIDQSLDQAASSARKFAARPMQTVASETMKRAVPGESGAEAGAEMSPAAAAAAAPTPPAAPEAAGVVSGTGEVVPPPDEMAMAPAAKSGSATG